MEHEKHGWMVPGTPIPMPRVNRVEVIDQEGRIFTRYSATDVQVAIQDDGRTLKVFLSRSWTLTRKEGEA